MPSRDRLRTTEFRGTVGEVFIDDHSVDLWDFIDDGGRCSAQTKWKPIDKVQEKRGWLFKDGYAQISSAGELYDSEKLLMRVKFATYVENGLLYFRGDGVFFHNFIVNLLT